MSRIAEPSLWYHLLGSTVAWIGWNREHERTKQNTEIGFWEVLTSPSFYFFSLFIVMS
jgi:hypothetical protein